MEFKWEQSSSGKDKRISSESISSDSIINAQNSSLTLPPPAPACSAPESPSRANIQHQDILFDPCTLIGAEDIDDKSIFDYQGNTHLSETPVFVGSEESSWNNIFTCDNGYNAEVPTVPVDVFSSGSLVGDELEDYNYSVGNDTDFLDLRQFTVGQDNNRNQIEEGVNPILNDIDIAAELVAELYKLQLEENRESVDSSPEEILNKSNLQWDFDIYPYCHPCEEDRTVDSSTLSRDFWIDNNYFDLLKPEEIAELLKLSDLSLSEDKLEIQATTIGDSCSGTMIGENSASSSLHHDENRPFNSASLQNEKVLLGHKETIFDLSFSPCGSFIATASQDSTIRIWCNSSNKLISTLTEHSKEYECLRVAWASPHWVERLCASMSSEDRDARGTPMILASSGADGIVKVWESYDRGLRWTCVSTLDHRGPGIEESDRQDENQVNDKTVGDDNKPQVYTLQFIDEWRKCFTPAQRKFFLLTSSDDFIHLWEPCEIDLRNSQVNMRIWFSIRFTQIEIGLGGVFALFPGDIKDQSLNIFQYPDNCLTLTSSKNAFGGKRNPGNLIYVFDASYCPTNNLLGVALSDGSLRLVNEHGACVSILQLPGCKSFLTSFAWDDSGCRLASCVATGQIILWAIDATDDHGWVKTSCRAVLEGGHTQGRPLYGVRYFSDKQQDFLISWGIDGNLCLWDPEALGNITTPLSVLSSKDNYPVFAADITGASIFEATTSERKPYARIGIAGGRDSGFIGLPFYVYDVTHSCNVNY